MMKVVRSCERRTGGAQPNSRCFECGEKEARRRARNARILYKTGTFCLADADGSCAREKATWLSCGNRPAPVNEMGRGFFFTPNLARDSS